MAVADAVRAHKVSALVVDPVLVASSGDSLVGSEVAHLCVCLCVQAVMAVADAVRAHKVSTLVVDPVLVATSGDSLAGSEVAQALKTHLFPLATVITPNLPEASALLGNRRVSDLATMKQASLIFHVFLGLVLGHASVFGHLVTPCSLYKHQSLLCNASPCRLPEYD